MEELIEKTATPKKFQHQEILSTLNVLCPPADFQEKETVAYRWVFETMEDVMNFVPQFLKKPDRFMKKSDMVKCLALGLSFFNSEASAKARFYQLKGFMGDTVYDDMGKKVAYGVLLPNMGVSSEAGRDGHFTFFPFKESSLESHFNIISEL